MSDQPAAPFQPWRWLLSALGMQRRQLVRKVPILGVEGSGKSSLIVTIGQYVSVESLGSVKLESFQLFSQLLPIVQMGVPQPPTLRYTPFHVEIRQIVEPDGGRLPVDLVLSSEDIPGQDFRLLCREISNNPGLSVTDGGDGAQLLQRFHALLSDCHGFVFVIDLLRDLDPAEFRRDPARHVGRAYSDQVQPIMDAVLLAARSNVDLVHKPMFFVFSKKDLHGLPAARVAADFERQMAIPLGPLRSAQVNILRYDIQCAGWDMHQSMAQLGVQRFLSDLAHATGAVATHRRSP